MKIGAGKNGAENFSPDCLIFDVDGVLIESSRSYPETVRIAVEREWEKAGFVSDAPGYSERHNRIFKRHGGFNDDTHIAWALLNIMASKGSARLSECFPTAGEVEDIISGCEGDAVAWLRRRFKEMFSLAPVARTCMKIYYGENGLEGMYSLEKPMLNAHWSELPLPAYIYTGRGRGEWQLAKKIMSWEGFPDERVVSSDSGVIKPSPNGLSLICEKFGHEHPIFFGDTASDKMSFDAFGRGRFAAIGEILRDEKPNFASVGDALFQLTGWRDR
jgi:phosphoglycolate phosphatase-like HAD superfamily hydrolase